MESDNTVLTNEQKYNTAEERIKAFDKFCKEHEACRDCKALCGRSENRIFTSECMAYWLALEAEEEKPEPCPFCGKEVVVGFSENIYKEKYRQVWCSAGERCGYECVLKKTEAEAIAAHNRVARAVRAAESEKGE